MDKERSKYCRVGTNGWQAEVEKGEGVAATRPTALFKEDGVEMQGPDEVKQRWHGHYYTRFTRMRARLPANGESGRGISKILRVAQKRV